MSNVVVEAEPIEIVRNQKSYSGTEYERVIERIKETINDPELAEHVAFECYSQTKNGKECVKHLVGVSNAESTMFRSCGNNCFGMMVCRYNDCKLKQYADRKHGITDRVATYVRLGRSKRNTAQKRLDANYCASECKTRIQNYNHGVEKLGL